MLVKRKNECLVPLILVLMLLNGSGFMINPVQADSSTWDESFIAYNNYHHNPLTVDGNGWLYTADVTYESDPISPYTIRVYRSTDDGNSWTQWKYCPLSSEPQGLDMAVNLYNNHIYMTFIYEEGSNEWVYLWRLNDNQFFEVDSTTTVHFYDTSVAIDFAFGTSNYIYVAYCSYDYDVKYTYNWRSHLVWKRATESGLANMNDYKRFYSEYYWFYSPDLAIGGDTGDVFTAYSRVTMIYNDNYNFLSIIDRSGTSIGGINYYSGFDNPSVKLQPSVAVSRHRDNTDRIIFSGVVNESNSYYIRTFYSTGGGDKFYETSSQAPDIEVGDPECKVALSVDGMSTTSNVLSYFYMVYFKKEPGRFDYVIRKAFHSNLGSWTHFHTGESAPLASSQPSIVTSLKGHGGWGPVVAFTDSVYFSYVAGDFITLTAPTLSSPANNHLTNDQTPTLSWSSVTGADTYEVQIDTSSSFTDPLYYIKDQIASTSHIVQTPLIDGTYYWRVRACDSAYDFGPVSSYRSFTVDTVAPSAPTLVSPYNNYRTSSQSMSFDWNAVSGATQYQLKVYDSSDDEVYSYTTSNTDHDIPTTLSEDTYSWKVRAQDGAGNWGSYSSERFFTIDLSGPAKAVLISPVSGATIADNSVLLTWNSIADATAYQVQVDTSITFSTTIVNQETSQTQINTGIITPDRYYWRVRGKDDVNNYGTFSDTWYFDLEGSDIWNLTGSPIIIDDDGGTAGAITWSEAVLEPWCSYVNDRYVIQNVIIDGQGSSNCITIKDSTIPFT
ncbi:MAG: hypothetical protein ACTSW1_13245, partial [Candidatus Hodarchaeales archaeon]